MGKKVRLMIELDSHFVAILRANLTLHGFEREQDVLHVLGIAVLGEAMGGYPEQIWQKIPPVWRPHIDIISDKREVVVDGGAEMSGFGKNSSSKGDARNV